MRRLSAVARVFVLFLGLVSAGAGDPQQREEDTHGRAATPDYARVFAQDVVKRLDIRVTAADWERLVADMTEMAGAVRGRGRRTRPRRIQHRCRIRRRSRHAMAESKGTSCTFGTPPQSGRCTLLPMGVGAHLHAAARWGKPWRRLSGGGTPAAIHRRRAPPGGGNQPGGNVGRDDVEFLPRTPIYIPATLTFDGISFTQHRPAAERQFEPAEFLAQRRRQSCRSGSTQTDSKIRFLRSATRRFSVSPI